MTPEMAQALAAARTAKRPVVLATNTGSGSQLLWPDTAVEAELAAAAERALHRDEAATITLNDTEWFLHPFCPPIRLIIVGAVHIAQTLAPMAALLGLNVTLIDPRRSFASPERFPDVTMIGEWPDDAMDALAPDSRTAVVTLTHDPKLDDPALDRALRSDTFYIGALGSRKTHANRLSRLRELGHDDAALARIRGPVGLNIGAVTAAEIALSILGEFVAVRRNAAL